MQRLERCEIENCPNKWSVISIRKDKSFFRCMYHWINEYLK